MGGLCGSHRSVVGAYGPAGKLTLSRPRACEVSLSTEL